MVKKHMTGIAVGALCALIFSLVPAPASALTAGDVAAGVQDRYSSLAALSADFKQESRIVTLGRSRHKEGTILFKRPGKMRWDYPPPDPQIIVSDGATLWYYRPEKNQVVVRDIGAAFVNQTPLLFLFGKGDLAAEFRWEEKDLAPGDGGLRLLELLPRLETPDLVSLALEVREDFSIAATILTDAFGNVTRLEFSGEEENSVLEDSLFSFTIPEGAEVLKP